MFTAIFRTAEAFAAFLVDIEDRKIDAKLIENGDAVLVRVFD